jgi:hypothetical protein
MTTWDPLDFVWPRLHEALQDPAFDEEASAAWEQAASLYSAYLKSVIWPDGIRDVQANGSLHDAKLIDLWIRPGCVLMTLCQDDGAWDGRDYVCVLKYKLATVLPEEAKLTAGKTLLGGVWRYDQWADLGDGSYRHFLYFSCGIMRLDIIDVQATRVFMPDGSRYIDRQAVS